MNSTWTTSIWPQFGAAIDMLDHARKACPARLWRESLFTDPSDAPEYTEFWYIVYHALFWRDLYLSGAGEEGFAPPAPFIRGSLPQKPYTKAELQTYLLPRSQTHSPPKAELIARTLLLIDL